MASLHESLVRWWNHELRANWMNEGVQCEHIASGGISGGSIVSRPQAVILT